MNWKIKLVLLFGKLRKPIDINSAIDIKELRKKSDRAAWLGSVLFDKKVPIAAVTDADADGVPVRIYNPGAEKNKRVIIYYHGGGFVLYGIYSHEYVCRRLSTMNNAVVVSVDYRMAPEHTFPAAHEDSFRAIQWVRKYINLHYGNPDDIVVAGDSAGGNLSACMAHRCKKEGISLKAQVLIYPWIDGKLNNPSIDRNGKGYLLEKATMFWFQQQYTPRKEDQCVPQVSPCYETDFTGLAPALVLTAQFDPLIDDGFKYSEQLKEAGNRVQYFEYKDLFHGFFNTPGVDAQAMKAYYDIKEFLATVK
ncbi:MAG TPA: alpha/beta hydrolase [Chitinophagales bacterium]|nr:alpha/beta hydrolase [Chitinophagales bacterium]